VTRWVEHTPDLNIGVIPRESGLSVVDVDDEQAFRGAKHPPTNTSTTTRGFHLWFKGEIRTGHAKWGDVVATYAVAPRAGSTGYSGTG
jgi:hypothetical protein